ncbi:nuclear transport factor 2 family protein [Neobacillus niacini]|uniref:nuclear transport factor 2 family protein n=1 Tax=Neobacillus niacini TaxID=86668 RepID=UPI002FFEB358
MVKIQLSLEERILKLEAKEEIRSLLANYCHSIDKRDREGFLRLWDEEASWKLANKEANGKKEIIERYDNVINGAKVLHHHTTNSAIEISGDSASVISDLFFYREDAQTGNTILMSAVYKDEFSKSSRKWLFKKRVSVPHTNKSPKF